MYKENISFWKIFSDSPCKAVDADGVGDEGEAAEHRHGHSLHPEGERLRKEGWTEVISRAALKASQVVWIWSEKLRYPA